MAVIIDSRTTNKAHRSADNRRKFINRIRGSIKDSLPAILGEGKFNTRAGSPQKVRVPYKKLAEPRFSYDRSDVDNYIVTGNVRFKRGDKIPKETASGSHKGGSGGLGAPSHDEFIVQISPEEFLNYFFNDLELPDLVRKELAPTIKELIQVNAGFQIEGPPGRLSITKSLKNAYLRRLAFISPSKREISEEKEKDEPNEERIAELERKIKRVPFIDTFDLRYRYYSLEPQPATAATMFCIQDISASLEEREKTIARKFFYLLYLFLVKKYQRVEIVWIVHTSEAKEVNEEEFFTTTEAGGTVISTALELAKKLIETKYNPILSNLYFLQISDGDNGEEDNLIVSKLLDQLIPLVQFFGYIQIEQEAVPFEWPKIIDVYKEKKNPKLKAEIIKNSREIWPIFKDLFKAKS
jgi:uncharacterized sporulation protein YeaH/YhbH (DUF444 family)